MLPTEDLSVLFAGGPNFDNLRADTHKIRLSTGERIEVKFIGAASITLGNAGMLVFEVEDVTNPAKPEKRYITASAIVEGNLASSGNS